MEGQAEAKNKDELTTKAYKTPKGFGKATVGVLKGMGKKVHDCEHLLFTVR